MNSFLILGILSISIGIILCLTAVRYYERKIRENSLSNWSKYEYFRLKLLLLALFFGGGISLLIAFKK